MPQYHNDFDPSKVTLAQSNLIEASAGTGKTFSIALMAVRLVVEKRIPLEKVLMVPFAKGATPEWEERATVHPQCPAARPQGCVWDRSAGNAGGRLLRYGSEASGHGSAAHAGTDRS